ncbi:transcription termination factor Rho [bacterium]|nr:transcription termination factor Rho [bacterium]
MTEKRPTPPKRTTRPRRRTTPAADAAADETLEHRSAETAAPRAIDDAFEEAAAARAEFDAPPSEQDMDFEALETRRPTRTRSTTTRKAAPRRRAAEPEAAPAPAAQSGWDDEGPADKAVGSLELYKEANSADAFNEEPVAPRRPTRRRAPPRAEVREEAPPDTQDSREFRDAPSESMDDLGPSDQMPPDSMRFDDDGSGPGPGQGGNGPDNYQDGQRRRRRRRRGGRDRGPQGGPMNQGGYGQQQGRYRQGPGNNQRRPPHQPRNDYQPRQDRGPQPPRADLPGSPVMGILELHPKGYGFLREAKAGYSSQDTDPFVSSSIIQKLNLREGVMITGEAVSGGRGQGPRLRQIDSIEGRTIEAYQEIRSFDELTAISPFEQIQLETGASPITMRVMDLLTPIGKGQRALIVAPPRSGKTMLLQEIADSVSKNHPEVYLMVLLIDERPEEVTEMRRRVHGEVIASSMDREVESHVRVSQLIFERAKRMAESGRDVFILLDSITRTARAFNKWTSNTGRTMSGGLDVKAMDIPKKMFGTARRFEEGGSLTVVGTALIDTGSRMDEVIFQEFKGTGNMELVLSRDLADRRIWPAIDISKSGTRREEKILSPEVMEGVTLLRRSLISLNPVEAMESLTKTLAKFPTNAEFLAKVRSIL